MTKKKTVKEAAKKAVKKVSQKEYTVYTSSGLVARVYDNKRNANSYATKIGGTVK